MQNYFKNLPPSTLVIIIETLVVLIVVGLILLYFLNKNGLVEVKKFIEVAWLKLMGFIFTPIVLVLGSTLGLWFLGPVEPHTFKSFLHELLIFLLIAGAVGAALHGKEFTKKFAELLYLSSNYLKDLSESNKKKFFANTLKKAYEFPKYGIEDEFATLTLDSWIPAFEEKYQSNHFIHRTIKPLEKGGKLEDGTLVYEKRGWRTHYPKNKAKASGYAIRVFKYKDFYELYKRLAFSSEVWMK
ncbi:hypothetical protein KAR91_76535, partial [Candidatus Pacearchaeota archaeon]|nr:hypothetical protein [Candidatus Pacearchaeota archaeon]